MARKTDPAEHVYFEEAQPIGVRNFEKRFGFEDSQVVHQNVRRTKLVCDLQKKRLDLRLVADVASCRQRAHTMRADRPFGFADARFESVDSGASRLLFSCLLAGFGVVASLVAIVAALWIGRISHQNVCQVIASLDQVELRTVLVVISGDVLRGDFDLRCNFFVQDFVGGQRSPDIALKVIN